MWAWDEAKRQANLAKHGVDFATLERFDWTRVVIRPDLRKDYGETRLRVFGMIGDRLHVLVYNPRGGTRRLISLRKANGREFKLWNMHAR